MGDERIAYRVLVRKREGNRPLGRHVDGVNMKVDRRELGGCGMDFIDLGQDKDQWSVLVNMLMNLRIP
jgi:hypothetical protein